MEWDKILPEIINKIDVRSNKPKIFNLNKEHFDGLKIYTNNYVRFFKKDDGDFDTSKTIKFNIDGFTIEFTEGIETDGVIVDIINKINL